MDNNKTLLYLRVSVQISAEVWTAKEFSSVVVMNVRRQTYWCFSGEVLAMEGILAEARL